MQPDQQLGEPGILLGEFGSLAAEKGFQVCPGLLRGTFKKRFDGLGAGLNLGELLLAPEFLFGRRSCGAGDGV
jgi:hypothetical protein